MIDVPTAPTDALDAARSGSALQRVGGVAEFLAVGGLTPILLPLAWWLRRALGLDQAELAVGFVMFYAAHVINDPHFAVTYLLFYENGKARALGSAFSPRQRVRYVIAGVLVPLVVGGWAGAALLLRSAFALSLMLQLMFLLVGWHYVKQGFGVLTVLAARRGMRFLPRERWIILAHCLTGWAYAWASPADPGRKVEEKGVVYMTLAHPVGLEHITLALWLCTIPLLAWVLVQKWRREHSLPLFTPLMALLCSVWAWSIYSSIDPLVRYAIPALHSVQYLYFVWLMKGNQALEREGPPWFEPAVGVRIAVLALSAIGLGWLLFHGLPSLLDDTLVSPELADTDLGPTPYFAALYAFVNIHHYFMDAVLWRHDNPLTRYLRVTGPNPG